MGILNILIVDDEEDMRLALQRIFLKKGYNTFLAADGQQAYDITLENRIDAIITDIRMPVMNGVDLLKKVKLRLPDLPVVFLITGFHDITEEEASRLGAAGLVTKPFNTSKIIQALETAISDVLSNSKTSPTV